jgi:hypothetical protein
MYVPQSGHVNGESENARWLALVQQQVERIQFGVVQIVIHESRVVRIERTEKLLVPEEGHETKEGRKP